MLNSKDFFDGCDKSEIFFQIEFCKFYGQVLFLFFPEDFLGLENPSIGCQNRALPSCNAAAEMSCDKTSQNFFFGPSKRSAEISILREEAFLITFFSSLKMHCSVPLLKPDFLFIHPTIYIEQSSYI